METKLSVLVSLFNWMQRSKSAAKKRSKFRKFLDTFCESTDYFSAIRLILPSLDRERGSYGLKESVLATCLIDALGIARDSHDALRLINWRKNGSATGVNAGNFSLVATEVLQLRQGSVSGGLTIKELNHLLDRLASGDNRAEKTEVLSTLIQKTNAQEMKWVIMIILKDLKLGISEKSIFHEFHPDAEDLFNVTCDLKLVCEKLRDRKQRHKRQDIEVGKAVRPQLAARVGDATTAWKKLHGKEVVVECKFDGDRIQMHKNGAEIHYYSRNFLDHLEYAHAMSDIIEKNILVDRCILDGEMLVWDASSNRFAEFGSNQEIAKAARDGLDSDRQLCYVAFDILYFGDTSVIHQSLKERHELLRKVVKPLKGRFEILLPDDGLNTSRLPGEACWSLVAHNVNDVERFFKQTVENRDEGIVLKDLGSKWDPGDRSGKWLKLKPDYIRAGSDLDVLIIGGYYGSGRRGGEVAQFLVGLAERASPKTYPKRFISFCRVGTGLSDEELDAVATKLKPYLRKYEYPKKCPPSFYQVTNNSKERPDVWVEGPDKSIILSITSDIRTIRSETFAAPYSLRFPRIDKVRYDKPWHECLDVQSFVELVQSGNGTTQKGTGYGGVQDSKPKRVKNSRKIEKQKVSIVPHHFVQTDISDIKGGTFIFARLMFSHSLDSLHKMVVENGGAFSMNLNNSVTYCVAAESKGIKYQAAKNSGDIIHCSWVFDCCSQKRLIPLQSKYFLHLSNSSKKKFQEEVDKFTDAYYADIDMEDLQQLFSQIDVAEDIKAIEYYKKKYSVGRWYLFCGCCVYFYSSTDSLTSDSNTLVGVVLRRLKLEVLAGNGKVSEDLSDATHLVILSESVSDLDLFSFMKSREKILSSKKLHIVGSRWLEDCLEKEIKLPAGEYSLKPDWMQVSDSAEYKDEHDSKCSSSNLKAAEKPGMSTDIVSRDEKQTETTAPLINSRTLASYKKDSKRKRGRPVDQITRKNAGRARRIPPATRSKRKPSKIYCDESEENGSSADEKTNTAMEIDDRDNSVVLVEESEPSYIGKPVEVEAEHAKRNTQDTAFDDIDVQIKDVKAGKTLETSKEHMADPVHAMLVDMIPSLGIKKNEPTTKSYAVDDDDAKLPEEATDKEIVKKKKVSYKDIAAQLLQDG